MGGTLTAPLRRWLQGFCTYQCPAPYDRGIDTHAHAVFGNQRLWVNCKVWIYPLTIPSMDGPGVWNVRPQQISKSCNGHFVQCAGSRAQTSYDSNWSIELCTKKLCYEPWRREYLVGWARDSSESGSWIVIGSLESRKLRLMFLIYGQSYMVVRWARGMG